MIKKCDLCGKKTTQLNKAASILKDVKDLKDMCNGCMGRMDAALLEVRPKAHKMISDALVAEAEKIRAEVNDE